MTLRRGIPGQSGTQWFFTEAGRPFSFYAVLGSHAQRPALVPHVNTLLSSLDAEPGRHRCPASEAPVELIGLYLDRRRPAWSSPAWPRRCAPTTRPCAMAALLPGAPPLRVRCAGSSGPARWRRPRSAPSPSSSRARSPRRWSRSPTCAFAGVVAYARWRGGPLATCGCFGRPGHAARPCSIWCSTSRWPLAAAAVRHRGPELAAPLAAAAGPPALGRHSRSSSSARSGSGSPRWPSPSLAALTAARHPARPGPVQGIVSISTALVERTAQVLEGRLSRRSLINRSAFVGSAVAVGSGLDLALKPGTAYGAICECGNAGCGCGSTCCSGFSEFCCAVSGANFCPENTVMGGWWVADNSSYCGGPRYYMDCNSTCSCDNGCSNGFAVLRAGLRRHRLRVRSAGLRLLPDRLPPVPVRAVQPGRRLHGPHRLPGRRLRPAVDGRSLLHHRRRRRQRHRGAERAVLDDRPAGAAVRLARHQLPGGRPGPECRRPRLRRAHRVRAAVRLRGLPQRRRRLGSSALGAPIVGVATCKTGGYFLAAADGGIFDYGGAPFLGSMGGRPLNAPVVGHGGLAVRSGLLAGRRRRRHLRLRRRLVLRLHGGQAPQCPGGRDGGHPDGPGLLAGRRPTAASSPSGTRPSSAPWAGSTSTHPVVGMAATPTGRGYWLVAADGGIFAYGDAVFDGSTGALRLNQPVVGMAPYGNDAGYWLVAKDGGIFAFGGAPFLGSPA